MKHDILSFKIKLKCTKRVHFYLFCTFKKAYSIIFSFIRFFIQGWESIQEICSEFESIIQLLFVCICARGSLKSIHCISQYELCLLFLLISNAQNMLMSSSYRLVIPRKYSRATQSLFQFCISNYCLEEKFNATDCFFSNFRTKKGHRL